MRTSKTLLALAILPSVVFAEPPADYYAVADDSTPENLRVSLHLIIDDHQRIPYTSSQMDTWDVLEIADQDQDEPGNITTIYRNVSFSKQGGGNDFYNREHTWPKSYGYPDRTDDNYPYTDMHALFLADADYNSARENRPYEDCSANCEEFITENNDGRGGGMGTFPGQSNWTRPEFTDGAWQVWSERQGDMARAQLYMDLRYEGGIHGITGFSEPDLILTNDRGLIDASRTGNNEATGYMGFLSTLLAWHAADPVDDIERQHHEAVFEAQGNRNPFIDHPEWAACIFESLCVKAVSNPAGLSGLWFDPQLDGEGYNVIVSEGGTTIFYYGYSSAGERLWLISSLFTGEWMFDQAQDLELFEVKGGVFDQPVSPADGIQTWGTLAVTFTDCDNGRFELDGSDGSKTSNAIHLAGIADTDCEPVVSP